MIRDFKFLIIMISIQQFQYELYHETLYLTWYKDIYELQYYVCMMYIACSEYIVCKYYMVCNLFCWFETLCKRIFRFAWSALAYFTMSYMTLIKSGPILSNFLNSSQLIRSMYILSLSAPVLSVCEFENSD